MTATTHVTIPTATGSVNAEYILPPGDGPAGALIIVHEWWGLNDDIRRLTGKFASQGWIALAVDLYHGKVTDDNATAAGLANELKSTVAIQDMTAAFEWLKAHPRVNGKVAVTGFCLGGSMALVAACNLSGLAAAVPFYGLGLAEFTDYTKAHLPIMGHFAKRDTFVSPERVEGVKQRAQKANANFVFHMYDANHAFMREADPSAYDAPSAQLAWDRTVTFLKQHLT